jgi:hypothetical protein
MSTIEELTLQLNAYVASNNAALTTSFRDVSEEMGIVRQRVVALEEALRDKGHGQEDASHRGKKSLIHMKMITPSVLSQAEQWKRWKGDIEEYCEESAPGMKEILERTKKSEYDVDEEWFGNDPDGWWERADQLWRLMRRFTDGEARRVIMSIRNDNGYEAWRKLHQQFEPSVVMREAQAMAQFTGMVNRRAKTPAETRTLMLELEERARRVEELTETPPDGRHVMSVIMGILDSETLKHTIHFQGMKKDVGELKRKTRWT